MARNYAADRQFLANVPGLQFTKPLDQLSNSYVHRLASSIRAQEGRGVPVSRQAARGHVVTPEHGPKGGRPKLPAAPQEYRGGRLPTGKYVRQTKKLPRPRVHKRPINVPERLDLSDGAIVDTRTEIGDTLRILRASGDDRVILTGYDCEHGVYRSLGVNRRHMRGWSARAMLLAWAESGLDFESWFILLANATDSDPNQAAATIGHVCLWTVYTYPRNAHLSRFQRARR